MSVRNLAHSSAPFLSWSIAGKLSRVPILSLRAFCPMIFVASALNLAAKPPCRHGFSAAASNPHPSNPTAAVLRQVLNSQRIPATRLPSGVSTPNESVFHQAKGRSFKTGLPPATIDLHFDPPSPRLRRASRVADKTRACMGWILPESARKGNAVFRSGTLRRRLFWRNRQVGQNFVAPNPVSRARLVQPPIHYCA